MNSPVLYAYVIRIYVQVDVLVWIIIEKVRYNLYDFIRPFLFLKYDCNIYSFFVQSKQYSQGQLMMMIIVEFEVWLISSIIATNKNYTVAHF